ncbi:MAG: alpha/beta hydrolase [Desulfosarcinaceae bacterium]|nr:alpha/beta hydrolase [Desulfosarcinaceae bacterium]
MKIIIQSLLIIGAIGTAALGAAGLFGSYRQFTITQGCLAPGEFVTVGQHDIHYLQRDGGNTPVVFLHGASSNAREWRHSLFDALPESLHLVAIDRPGLGHSKRSTALSLHEQVQLLHRTIQQLGLKRPVLVVHSLSGVMGARLLADYPQHYRGLVIIAGATYPIGDGASWYTRLATLPLLGHVFRYAMVPAIAPFIAPGIIQNNFHPQPVVPDYAEKACLELLFSPERFLANAEDLNQIRAYIDDSYPLYTKIRAPVSLIYGDQDQIIAQFTHAGGFKYKVPHAKYIMLPDVGHLPHYSRQDIVRQEIERILTVEGDD